MGFHFSHGQKQVSFVCAGTIVSLLFINRHAHSAPASWTGFLCPRGFSSCSLRVYGQAVHAKSCTNPSGPSTQCRLNDYWWASTYRIRPTSSDDNWLIATCRIRSTSNEYKWLIAACRICLTGTKDTRGDRHTDVTRRKTSKFNWLRKRRTT